MTHRLLALAVVGVLASSPLLAFANPLDSSWLPGFWDDSDYDNAVVRLTSTSSVAESCSPCSLEPYWIAIWVVPVTDDLVAPSPVFAPHPPRGPPLV